MAAAEGTGLPAYVSPRTQSTLVHTDTGWKSAAGEFFPVTAGIARFVPADSYAAAFGRQWKRYPRTQLDSYTGHPLSRDRLRRCLGTDLWNDLEGKVVLEAGCGAGRFTEVLLERKALVQSIDLSCAVEANAANFPESTQHRIAQADILQLPFAPEQFDVVLCLGVIQHTPNPEHTIAALARQVKPGGYLVIDHYTGNLKDWISYWCSSRAWLRLVLKRLPPPVAMQWVERLVAAFLPLNRWAAASHQRWIMRAVGRISPVLSYYEVYPELSDTLQREMAFLDSHDALTDYFKHWRNTVQIKSALQASGCRVESCLLAGNGVEARAQKPLTPNRNQP